MTIEYLDSKRISTLLSEIVYDINNADTQQETRSGTTTSNGVQILVNNSGIGVLINKIMFPMKKAGTPPSTFKYEIYNDAGTLQVGTETKSADSLTTSFVDTILTLTAPHTIVVGDRIVVTYGSGDTSNKVLVSEDNSVGTIPTNTTHTAYNSGWTQSTAQWSNAKIYSDGAKPLNVENNSILVQKDTASRFWFSVETTADVDMDFTDDAGWNNAGSVYDVNTTTEQLEGSVDRPYSGANTHHYYDLISGTVSDTAWLCNFKLVVDTTSYSTVRGTTYIILSSVTGATSGSVESGDHMGMALYINAGAGNFYAIHVNGGALTTNTISSSIVSGETTYYVSFIRNGDNFQFDLYSDIDRTVLVNSVNGTTSDIADLRYLRVQSETDGGSTYTGDVDFTIDDLKFYNGVTSVTPTKWNMNPTFEDDFSSNKAWTLNHSGSGQTISGGLLTSSVSPSNSYKYFAIGNPTNFVMDFDWEHNGGDTPVIIISSDTGGYGDPAEGNRRLLLFSANSDGNIKFSNRWFKTGDGAGGETNSSLVAGGTAGSTGVKYFWRFVKSGTSLSFKRYLTDADRTSGANLHQETIAEDGAPSGLTDYTYIEVGAYGSSGTNKLYDFKFYNGVTSPN